MRKHYPDYSLSAIIPDTVRRPFDEGRLNYFLFVKRIKEARISGIVFEDIFQQGGFYGEISDTNLTLTIILDPNHRRIEKVDKPLLFQARRIDELKGKLVDRPTYDGKWKPTGTFRGISFEEQPFRFWDYLLTPDESTVNIEALLREAGYKTQDELEQRSQITGITNYFWAWAHDFFPNKELIGLDIVTFEDPLNFETVKLFKFGKTLVKQGIDVSKSKPYAEGLEAVKKLENYKRDSSSLPSPSD